MTRATDFYHLHLHTEYSLLDGAVKPDELARFLEASGMRGAAITDHGSLFGAVEFHDALVERGLSPMIGMEAYIAPGSMHERSQTGRRAPYHHLTLLAIDEKGYRNLCRLSSLGWLEGFYFKPRIDKDLLAQHCDGLAIGSACLQGEIAQNLLAGNIPEADRAALFFRDLVGPDRFFVELMDHGLSEEKAVLPALAELAARTGCMPVATNDAHYLLRSHSRAHEVLLCLQTGRKMDDPGRMRFGTDEFYVKTPGEMARLFDWIPEAVGNTARIAELCTFRFGRGETLLPAFPIPEGSSMDSFLREKARSGLRDRLGRELTAEETGRLEYELGVISDMGFPGYFLIVAELREWAAGRGIAMGPGRGSAAGSLVSFAIGITDINPLEHGLSFDRFLNPARREMPDIDLDFCFVRRPEVIEHMVELYGRRSVSQIVTFNRMKSRSAIRDVVRAMGRPLDLAERMVRLLAQAEEGETAQGGLMDRVPQLAELAAEDGSVAEITGFCDMFENLARNTSVHAAGVIIAPGDLLDYVPLCRSKEEEITTQYEMRSLDRAGLLKLDVLGLRTVTVLQDAEAMIRRADPGFRTDSIPLDDAATFELLRAGETTGVFQLESAGMRDVLRRIGASRFEDVTAAVAIFRPGSMDMIDIYARNKQGCGSGSGFSIRYPHPGMEEILSETYGVMIYQEQVMAIANRLAGMSMAEADVFRKAMSKKNPEVMARQRERFVESASGRGIPGRLADEIFDQVEKFAGYGFNKSHAVSYALLAYRTAWMKVHHPAEFMAASMTGWIGNIEQITILAEECRRLGVRLLPPSVNEGSGRFEVDSAGSIVYALSAVRNVGEGPCAEITRAREAGGPFASVFDLAARVDTTVLNRRVLESLGGAGALDCLGPRARVIAAIDQALEFGTRARQAREAGQMSLFCPAGPVTLSEPELPDAPELSAPARLNLEKSLLGFYLSGHPLDDFTEELEAFTDIEPGDPLPETQRRIRTAGVVVAVREIPTRSGPLAFVTVEGRGGSSEVIVFSDVLERCRPLFETGTFLLLEGEVNQRREERRFSVTSALRMEEAREALRAGVLLRIDASGTSDESLRETLELVRRWPGRGAVRLEILHSSGRVVRAESRTLRVSPGDELLRGLRGILGGGVHLIQGARF